MGLPGVLHRLPGIPCTLRRIGDSQDIPGLLHQPRLATSVQETHDAAERAFAEIRAAMKAVDELDPKGGAKERREAVQQLRSAIANATPNVDLAARSLSEHAENVVSGARADIEAMVAAKAEQLGVDPSHVTAAGVTWDCSDRADDQPAIGS